MRMVGQSGQNPHQSGRKFRSGQSDFDPTFFPRDPDSSGQNFLMTRNASLFYQLGNFNVFDGQKYIVPLHNVWEVVKREGFQHSSVWNAMLGQ
jgi:hypothetical protein